MSGLNYIGKTKMICKKCNKPIKEDTEGDLRYCQGHSILDKEQKEVNNE